ncbi:MAG: DNA-processing protein DprA [Bacillota bacterium]|nr:DNA-processing protein DprA [Bacillota bacterium]
MAELKYWIWFSHAAGGHRVIANSLLEAAENDPFRVYKMKRAELERAGIKENELLDALSNKELKAAEKEVAIAEKFHIRILSRDDTDYPADLRNIADMPYVLYFRGKSDETGEEKLRIGIVGSRRASEYGKKVAHDLAYELAKRGVVIVSGMATGIDGEAHRGALEAGGKTIAVLGCGVNVVYPKDNDSLMIEIMKNGEVISEFAFDTPPLKWNFPQRNRILSGLCHGIIVVEAEEESGAVITANLALEQGKELFAIPGNITSPTSVGTNRLIKNGATPVMCTDDVMEEFPEFYIPKIQEEEQVFEESAENEEEIMPEQIILKVIRTDALTVDEISIRTGFPLPQVSTILTMLELSGLADALPGHKYIRTSKLK